VAVAGEGDVKDRLGRRPRSSGSPASSISSGRCPLNPRGAVAQRRAAAVVRDRARAFETDGDLALFLAADRGEVSRCPRCPEKRILKHLGDPEVLDDGGARPGIVGGDGHHRRVDIGVFRARSSGYSRRGPTSVTTRLITVAKTGRWIETSESFHALGPPAPETTVTAAAVAGS